MAEVGRPRQALPFPALPSPARLVASLRPFKCSSPPPRAGERRSRCPGRAGHKGLCRGGFCSVTCSGAASERGAGRGSGAAAIARRGGAGQPGAAARGLGPGRRQHGRGSQVMPRGRGRPGGTMPSLEGGRVTLGPAGVRALPPPAPAGPAGPAPLRRASPWCGSRPRCPLCWRPARERLCCRPGTAGTCAPHSPLGSLPARCEAEGL